MHYNLNSALSDYNRDLKFFSKYPVFLGEEDRYSQILGGGLTTSKNLLALDAKKTPK